MSVITYLLDFPMAGSSENMREVLPLIEHWVLPSVRAHSKAYERNVDMAVDRDSLTILI